MHAQNIMSNDTVSVSLVWTNIMIKSAGLRAAVSLKNGVCTLVVYLYMSCLDVIDGHALSMCCRQLHLQIWPIVGRMSVGGKPLLMTAMSESGRTMPVCDGAPIRYGRFSLQQSSIASWGVYTPHRITPAHARGAALHFLLFSATVLFTRSCSVGVLRARGSGDRATGCTFGGV